MSSPGFAVCILPSPQKDLAEEALSCPFNLWRNGGSVEASKHSCKFSDTPHIKKRGLSCLCPSNTVQTRPCEWEAGSQRAVDFCSPLSWDRYPWSLTLLIRSPAAPKPPCWKGHTVGPYCNRGRGSPLLISRRNWLQGILASPLLHAVCQWLPAWRGSVGFLQSSSDWFLGRVGH